MYCPLTIKTLLQHNKDGDLWVIIDAKVFDLTKFANFHPGGKAVLLDSDVSKSSVSSLPIVILSATRMANVEGQDCTELFYSLHRSEVLLRPQYARLQIGVIPGQTERFKPPPPGSLSPVPYGGV